MFTENDFCSSTSHDCISIVERLSPGMMYGQRLVRDVQAIALTATDKAKLMKARIIKSIAPPIPKNAHVSCSTYKPRMSLKDCPECFAAAAEILANEQTLKHGEIRDIIAKHGAQKQLVYNLLFQVRHGKRTLEAKAS